jgi:hypothetical protein
MMFGTARSEAEFSLSGIEPIIRALPKMALLGKALLTDSK